MKEIKCKNEKCRHEWKTKTKYLLISCPCCGTKNKTDRKSEIEGETFVKFVGNGKVLKKCKILGFQPGDVDFIKRHLSIKHHIGIDCISVEID